MLVYSVVYFLEGLKAVVSPTYAWMFSYSSIFFLTNIIKWNYLAKIMIFREFGKKNKKKVYKIVQIVVQQR